MDLQQIKYFPALSQELHFWKTAERMFITQSALSRQIKALEDELGIKLFERSKKSVRLTEAGIFLRDKWQPLLEEINRIHTQAKRCHEGATGFIRIGYPGSIAYSFMPKLITGISEVLPDLKMELVEPTDIYFEHLLLNYQLDIAFRRDPAESPALQCALPNVRFIALPYEMNLYVTWRKNDDSPILKNVLQLVTDTAGEFLQAPEE